VHYLFNELFNPTHVQQESDSCEVLTLYKIILFYHIQQPVDPEVKWFYTNKYCRLINFEN